MNMEAGDDGWNLLVGIKPAACQASSTGLLRPNHCDFFATWTSGFNETQTVSQTLQNDCDTQDTELGNTIGRRLSPAPVVQLSLGELPQSKHLFAEWQSESGKTT